MQKKKIWWTIGLLVLMWMSLTGQYLNVEDTYDLAWLYGLIDFVVISAIMMVIPFIYRMVKGKRLEVVQGKKICKWNSIGMFIFSIVLSAIILEGEGTVGVGGLGAIMFYFINKWLFVNEDIKAPMNDYIHSNKFKCNNCGNWVSEDAKYCPNCSMIFETEKQEELFKCDNCGAIVRESDKFCSKCGESFEDENDDGFECSNCGATIPVNAKKCQKCLLPIEMLEDDGSIDEVDYEIAVSEYQKGNTNKAEEIFKKFIKQNEMKENEERILDFNNHAEFVIYAKRFNKDNDFKYITTNISNAYLYLGMIEFDKKDFDNSIKYLNKSIKYNPMNIMAMFEKVENYKAKNDLEKYYSESKKLYKFIYNIHDLAHYYRNLGYYFIEQKEWEIAKALYLYSVTKEMSDTASHEIAYICEKSNNKDLIDIKDVKEILEDNSIPLTLSEENIKIINELYDSLKKENKHNSQVGTYIRNLISENNQ